jgi:hypothetical protein
MDNPRIVLLTPGPHNETYFEHSYIARYLGFTLVEGADLTVRDRCVYLKTVDGLRTGRRHSAPGGRQLLRSPRIAQRILLGVPGLGGRDRRRQREGGQCTWEAVLIETAAVMPFLPGLSRHLLGEDLKLPSVATWWCGQEPPRTRLGTGPPRIPWWSSRRFQPAVWSRSSGLNCCRSRGKSLPNNFGHGPTSMWRRSTSPYPPRQSGRTGTSISRSVVLRAYVLNTGNGWIALPGGLTRVAEVEGPIVSMQRGGHSKDAWVLWDSPVDTFSMLRPRSEPVELRRVAPPVPSRVADNVFWLGRYVERAENIARIVRSMISRVRRADEAELTCLIRLHSCLESRHSKLPKAKRKRPTSLEFEQELISVLTNPKRPDSLASTLAEVSRVGGNVRERLSSDMNFLISQLRDSIQVEHGTQFLEYPATLTACLELLSAFSGMERENINRGSGWLFMSIGRRLERAIYLTRQLARGRHAAR